MLRALPPPIADSSRALVAVVVRPLTHRQGEVLAVLQRLIEEHGIAPTLREIGRELGIRSTNGVNDHLRALERKGYITRKPMMSRALVLVRNPGERSSAAKVDFWARMEREYGGGYLQLSLVEPEETSVRGAS